ncbi:MAG: histidine phosphatase family protein, partial [Pseudonocardiaceae bacterium]
RPAAIMSSPLARAYQRASAIAVACGRTVEVDADLIDRDYGPVAGRSRNEVEREYAALDTIAGVEPLDRLAARVTAALDRLTDRTRATPLVLVAHDVVNRVLLSRLLPARFVDPEQVSQRTGCWNRLEHGAAGWRVLVVDAVPGDGRVP